MSRIIESCMDCFSHHMARETGNLSCLKTNTRITDANIIPADCPFELLDDKMREAWEACFIATEHGDTCDTIQVTITFDEWRNQNEH